ncbi:hypothetical protein ANT2_0289 [plant metagenome]|uniref:RmlD-like substrate binding domain-containing protein n=1 Tax=plant metagenome TaxID=1297885 RepID=A0A484RN90_9ZZZZ
MPLRILLLGGTGQLGRALRPVLEATGTVHAPARQELDLTDTAALRHAVVSSRPDVVVNAAAPAAERTLAWDDPSVGIQWPLLSDQSPILSAKDRQGLRLQDLKRAPPS